MKKYIKPELFCEKMEIRDSLLAGSGPEGSEVDVGMAKKKDISFSDDWGEDEYSWPKAKSPWDV